MKALSFAAFAALLALAHSLRAQSYTFTPVSGVYSPAGIACDANGNVYFASMYSHVIQKVSATGAVSTIAGQSGNSGSIDGSVSIARFSNPRGLALAANGDLYVVDSGNHTIRKITAAGVVSTVAGIAGIFGTVDGSGSNARFNYPEAIAIDPSGNLFVTEPNVSLVRKITPSGSVTTFAGSAGQFAFADGTGAAARFNRPQGITADAAGNIYVADTANHVIRKITPEGVVTTLAGLPGNPGYGDGVGIFAQFNSPVGIVVDRAGNIFVSDTGNYTMRKITPTGVVTTLGGTVGFSGDSAGTGSLARFSSPRYLALDSAGTLFVGDYTLKLGTPVSQPAFTVHPQNASVAAGAIFSLNATATGAAPLTYQWIKNGSAIPGATSPSLNFANVQPTDAGTYSVTATNTVGIVTSNSATLTVLATLPNNNFANAEAITTNAGFTSGRNNGATGEPGEPTHTNSIATATSVWYRWTPTQSGTAVFDVSANFSVASAAYTGNTLLTLVRVGNASGSRLVFSAVAGTTYSLAIGSYYANSSGNFTLTWRTLVTDNFSAAQEISGSSGQVSGNNSGATGEAGEPVHFAGSSASSTSIWYRWTPTQDVVATFTTVGSDISTVLAAYTGSALTGLTRVAQDFNSGANFRSRIVFVARANTPYSIVVGSYYGGGGNIVLNWQTTQSPVLMSPAEMGFVSLTTSGASNSALSVPAGVTVTARFTAVSVTPLTISWQRNGSALPGTNTALLALQNVQPSDAGTYTATISNGVDTITTNPLVLTVFSPPANDNFANATTTSGLTGSISGTNVNATGETGEPAHWSLAGAASSVWWKWTPPSSGLAVVDTVGSNFDTVLAVYTGTALTSLTRLVQDDDRGGGRTSQVSFAAVGGTTYYIAVGGSTASARGNITLNWQLTPVVAITTQPISQTIAAGGSATFSVGATGTNAAYQWYRNSVAIPGATNATLTVSNIQSGADASFTVTVTTAGGTVTSSPATLSVAAPTLTNFTVRRSRAEGNFLWSIAAGAGQLVAVGHEGVILSSADRGATWTPRVSGNTAWLVAVTYGNGQFVVVGDEGRILTSTDGITWTPAPAPATKERLNNILYADDKYVAIGEHGTVATSLDARTWTLRSTPVTTWLHGLAWNASIRQFATAGENGVLLTSPDAVTWTPLPIPGFTGHLHHIVAVDSYAHFVVAGDQGKVISVRQNQLVLKDGQSLTIWSAEAIATNISSALVGMVQGAGVLFATSEDGKVITAANDRGPWYSLRSGIEGYLLAGLYTENRLYIVGQQETVIESDPIYATRLVNISTRGQVGTGGNVLISGFSVTGSTAKRILVRAVGPALAGFGVTGQLAAPTLTLFDRDAKVLATNSGWSSATNVSAISAATTTAGAFPFAAGSADCAILTTLEPGNYTAQIAGANNTTGIALVEAYDIEPLSVETSRAVNVSTRGVVGAGQNKMIAGFVIDGSSAKRVLIRAIGPALAGFGVAGTVAEPQLELYTSRGLLQASAGAWGLQNNADEIRGANKVVGAFDLADGSKDSAMLVTLLPGAWTVQVGGAAGASGVALVEVYVLP